MTQAELRKRERKGKKVGRGQNRKIMRVERKRRVRGGNRVSARATSKLLRQLVTVAQDTNQQNTRPTKETLEFTRLLQQERKLTREQLDRVAI